MPLQWKNYPIDNQNVKIYQQLLLKKTALKDTFLEARYVLLCYFRIQNEN